jgi:hypothetical protein
MVYLLLFHSLLLLVLLSFIFYNASKFILSFILLLF